MANIVSKLELTLENINYKDYAGKYIYAIFRKECFIKKIDDSFEIPENVGEALEIHIFDENEELRYVKNKLNKNNEFIQIKDADSYKKYCDKMIFAGTKVDVINYYTFVDGMIQFVNYRLSFKEVK